MTPFRPLAAVAVALAFAAQGAAAADKPPKQPKPPANAPEQPATAGRASFKFGEQAVDFDKVRGTFKRSYGLTVLSLVYGEPAGEGDHLNVNLFLKRKGRVDMEGGYDNGVGYWTGGKVYAFNKGKSRCKISITKLTATTVEGKGDCPVLNEVNGSGKAALSALTFSAATK